MSDLKTFWDKPGMPMSTDLGGDAVVSSGTDPQVSLSGENALQPFWTNDPVPKTDGEESSNSVSGLPQQPSRFQPTEIPPPLPTLQDRRPGTIDEQ
jgi:hypothetical protein